MQELLTQMRELRDRAYKEHREAELTENGTYLAYLSGVLTGMDRMVDLAKEFIKE